MIQILMLHSIKPITHYWFIQHGEIDMELHL